MKPWNHTIIMLPYRRVHMRTHVKELVIIVSPYGACPWRERGMVNNNTIYVSSGHMFNLLTAYS